jgi:hypothetical protein
LSSFVDATERRGVVSRCWTGRYVATALRIVDRASSIFVQRHWGSAFERGYAWGAESFGRHEPNGTFATLAGRGDTLALNVLKEGALLWPVNVPEAEIIVTDGGHLSVFPF